MCRMALGNDFFVFYMFSVFLKAKENGDQKSVKLAIFMVVILFMVQSICHNRLKKGYSLLILKCMKHCK